ncbi:MULTISPECIES: helix-turn-helix domain-containing protein [unclassified Solwaraspora]|uniref:helix-turn-helix domain-containing protein n=1 Tax=unclassified Solwaraspora TaxID=2627926 RepID=UPI00248BB743|nr:MULTISPECIES: helix-turn-helix domain-containing protein [unclassified Solwaraspora]WBB99711.1 helix-turn-helix domain-containing protein [Solwaraspora sp. WMMA2059]WBC21739.1 helix-turn-helix domain-containing protein [Solwaraspora sp. WMMA2080]WJK36214.1 helix-turn-helix domain-containing protein [Solwaraspora sp. WMMA2065]
MTGGTTPPGGSGSSLADKLNLLFETVRPARRDPYTSREVADAIRDRGGSISDVYIWQLRTGRRTNPTKEHLEALADFFDVDPAYFFDRRRSGEIERDLHALQAMRNLKVRAVATRLSTLPEAQLDAVGEILDRVVQALQTRHAEGGPGAEGRQDP